MEPAGTGAYPPSWETDVVLSDGHTVRVRPIVPADADALVRFHQRQSAESIYFRYFSPRPAAVRAGDPPLHHGRPPRPGRLRRGGDGRDHRRRPLRALPRHRHRRGRVLRRRRAPRAGPREPAARVPGRCGAGERPAQVQRDDAAQQPPDARRVPVGGLRGGVPSRRGRGGGRLRHRSHRRRARRDGPPRTCRRGGLGAADAGTDLGRGGRGGQGPRRTGCRGVPQPAGQRVPRRGPPGQPRRRPGGGHPGLPIGARPARAGRPGGDRDTRRARSGHRRGVRRARRALGRGALRRLLRVGPGGRRAGAGVRRRRTSPRPATARTQLPGAHQHRSRGPAGRHARTGHAAGGTGRGHGRGRHPVGGDRGPRRTHGPGSVDDGRGGQSGRRVGDRSVELLDRGRRHRRGPVVPRCPTPPSPLRAGRQGGVAAAAGRRTAHLDGGGVDGAGR